MPQEGGFGQDLQIDDRRPRLKWDGRQLLGPMEPAGRIQVQDGDGENQPPPEGSNPSSGGLDAAHPPPANGVVAVINRLQEGIEMLVGPGLGSGRQQDQRERCPGDRGGNSMAQIGSSAVNRNHPQFAVTGGGAKTLENPSGNGRCAFFGERAEDDHQDPCAGERLAMKMAGERISIVRLGGDSHSSLRAKREAIALGR